MFYMQCDEKYRNRYKEEKIKTSFKKMSVMGIVTLINKMVKII